MIASHVVADDLLPPEHSVEQAIDHYVGARLKSEQVTPAAEASAQVLRRRTMLDLVGRIPTAAESKGGLDGAQRVALVDQLMSTPAFDRHQADEFDAMLMHDVGDSLRDYLRQAFQAKRPWNEIFKDVIVGEPEDAKQQGAIKYVRSRVGDLDKLANKVSSDFFGVNVSCARCHDHPEAAEWTQAHFFGMKSFFNRTFDNGGLIGERSYGLVEYKTTAGESRTAKLMFLTGAVVEEPEPKSLTDAEKKAEKKKLEELKKKKEALDPAVAMFPDELRRGAR
ncbi:MAG: DUF1549 domain-containing protein [Pirellulaceae bacterium]|nr:DUF1549 domain-containing protein [Pirellulaceae bacterium]